MLLYDIVKRTRVQENVDVLILRFVFKLNSFAFHWFYQGFDGRQKRTKRSGRTILGKHNPHRRCYISQVIWIPGPERRNITCDTKREFFNKSIKSDMKNGLLI